MQIATLPIEILFSHDGFIGFQRLAKFNTIIDQSETLNVIMDDEMLSFRDKNLAELFEIPYNNLVAWRDNTVLVEWLQKQNMSLPI